MKGSMAWLIATVLIAGCAVDDPVAPGSTEVATVVAQEEATQETAGAHVARLPATFGVGASGCTREFWGEPAARYNCVPGDDLGILVSAFFDRGGNFPVDRGTIVFMTCETRDGPAPSSECADGRGRWNRVRRPVDETGPAEFGFGLEIGQTLGITWIYYAQGSGLENTPAPLPIDFHGGIPASPAGS